MFVWCTERLHLSESEAYLRIAVARASRRHPMLLSMLADGRIHLSGIERLAPHLTVENREDVLKRAAHRSRRRIEELVAELAPRPSAPASLRKLPERRRPAAGEGTLLELRTAAVGPAGPRPTLDGVGRETPALRADGAAAVASGAAAEGGAPDRRELRPDGAAAQRSTPDWPTRAVEAVAPARFRLQFDLDTGLRDRLERLQALMRSSVPDGDLGKVIEIAVTWELARLEARRFAKTKKPRKPLAQPDTKAKSRYIPAAVRRHVEVRDGGRCTYRDRHGRRCPKRHDLEFHHRRPFGRGGDHGPEGLALMCRVNNALLAEEHYGKEKMARHRRRARSDGKGVGRGEWGSDGERPGGAVAAAGVEPGVRPR